MAASLLPPYSLYSALLLTEPFLHYVGKRVLFGIQPRKIAHTLSLSLQTLNVIRWERIFSSNSSTDGNII